MEPVLDVPLRVSDDGLLVVQGHYNTLPYQVRFSMKYIHGREQWKLFGIDVDLKKAEPEAPTDK